MPLLGKKTNKQTSNLAAHVLHPMIQLKWREAQKPVHKELLF